MKIGVIGAGYWGPNLIRNFARATDATLDVVCDLRPEVLDNMRRIYPNLQTTRDYKDLFGDIGVDAVVIATPAASHFDLAADCLRHGKDVLIEKPLAVTSGQARQLIELAEKGKRILMVGHTFDYSPPAKKLQEVVASSELGRIYYTYSQRLNLGQVRRDVNAMWNLAPHDLSIVLRIMNPELPVEVSAHGYSYLQEGIEDVVYMNLRFPSGIASHIHVSWLDPGKIRRTTVVGSEKMVVFDDTDSEAPIHIYNKGFTKLDGSGNPLPFASFGEFRLMLRAGDVLLPKVDTTEPLYNEVRHFLECVRNRTTPYSDGLAGLRVVCILEAAQRSLAKGGQTVTVDLE